MLPLVAIATALIPDLIRVLAGDTAGTVAQHVAEAVRAVAGTDDPLTARKKLEDDPAAAAALRVKLAQIALEATRLQNEAEDRRRQAELEQLKAQLQAEDKKRDDEITQWRTELKSQAENTSNARSLLTTLAQSGSPMQWVPALISGIVIVFFALAVGLLILAPGQAEKGPFTDLLNICVGALVAGFSTVISYWLGSSQGSRDKEITNRQIQVTQVDQANRQIEVAARQTTDIIKAATERTPAVPVPVPVSPTGPVLLPKVDNFDACVQLVLSAEGGFADNPQDPGGATNFGITLATLADWRRHRASNANVTATDVRALTREEATEIYRTNYWNLMRCGDLPKGVDLLVFDFGVNAGPGTSAKILQKLLGVDQDGSIGPVTVNALGLADRNRLIHDFSTKRLEYYRSLGKLFDTFGAGWTNRTNCMEDAAVRMAA